MPAGYTGTPLIKKLGLKPGTRVCFVSAPRHLASLLGPLPDDVTLLSRPGKEMDYLHLFTQTRADLERRLPGLVARLAPAGRLWISWPATRLPPPSGAPPTRTTTTGDTSTGSSSITCWAGPLTSWRPRYAWLTVCKGLLRLARTGAA